MDNENTSAVNVDETADTRTTINIYAMSPEEFYDFVGQHPELRLFDRKSAGDLAVKLRKSKRNESDWNAIKELLRSHAVMSAVPVEDNDVVSHSGNLLAADGLLHAFFSIEELRKYMAFLHEHSGLAPNVQFRISIIPFHEAVKTADETGRDLFIGCSGVPFKKFIVYSCKDSRILTTHITKKN